MNPALIKINSVSKSYRRGQELINVLNDLTIEVNKGEFIALMGPSGSGKTTLLNLIAGLDAPDAGTISIGDTEVSRLSDASLAKWRSRNVGFVFQFYNLIPVLNAAENVALPLNLFNLSNKERMERAKFALKVVGLEERADHFPSQLSGGQEQRVAIARSIVTDPMLLVADEPTGDLDRNSATEIMQLLSRLNKEFGKTIIMVTHDQTAAGYASRLVQLDKGRLKEAA